jgi:hypothetical protein
MPTRSTIPALKRALYARLAADSQIVSDGITVTYGWPYAKSQPTRETIYIGGSRSDPGQSAVALGAMRREERYQLELMAWRSSDTRADQQGVTERAFEIAGYVEESIRSWGGPQVADSFSFSSTGVRLVEVVSLDHDEDIASDGRFAVVHITLACQARI